MAGLFNQFAKKHPNYAQNQQNKIENPKPKKPKKPGGGGGGGKGGGGGGGLSATIPPLGSFDPALEAQRGSARRGLSDLVGDTATNETRAREDYTTQLADYLRSYTRGTEDLGTQTQALQRKYDFLGNQQGEKINATGQIRGGALAASAAARAANQAFEYQPIQTAQNRLGEDYSTNVNLAGRSFTRGQQDRSTNLSRAIREQQIGEADITAQEYFDASQRNPTMKFPSSIYAGAGGGLSAATKPKKPKKGKK